MVIQHTQLDLLRHGECEGGHIFRGSTDVSLTKEGWQQMAESVGRSGGWDMVVTSPLVRCTEFARQLSASQGIPLLTLPEIREMDFGQWEGKAVAQVQIDYAEQFQQWATDPVRFNPPGSEPIQAVAKRVEQALAYCLSHFSGTKILWVAHGGIIRVTLALCIQKHFDLVNGWHVPYGCLSQLSHFDLGENQRWQLVGHNVGGE